MEQIRTPYQGVWNIIRFNWHFYVISALFMIGLVGVIFFTPVQFHWLIYCIMAGVLFTIIVSLVVSFYVYDCSNLYKLDWLQSSDKNLEIININAGFDELSHLLQCKFYEANLTVLDFYNPDQHTEVSIKRARKAYPPYPNTRNVSTLDLLLAYGFADKIFVFLAAHEIRDDKERIIFFEELAKALKPAGQIIVTEHLRDLNNFLAYNIGFFHFLSKKNWHNTFSASNLYVKQEQKLTPFISTFILEKHGATS